jgi:hypothetical protein
MAGVCTQLRHHCLQERLQQVVRFLCLDASQGKGPKRLCQARLHHNRTD